MSTKNEKLIEQSFTTSKNQYFNLNLNQSKKCSILVPVQSYSKLNNEKYCATDFLVSNNYTEKEKLQSWKKSIKASTFTTLNENNDDLKNRWKNGNTLKITNKSTLSLHIAAYKNTTEAVALDLFDNENIDGLKKQRFNSIKIFKQCFTDSLKFRNPFEFPRQQNGDQSSEPEIMQFSASQQLLGSQPPTSQQTENNDEQMVQHQLPPDAGTAASNLQLVGSQMASSAGTSQRNPKMLNEREEALNDLKEQLVRLKDNNKNQIQLITLIADDHSQYAEDIVKLVSNHIKEAPSELKLYGLYAMDSIIKFPTGTLKEKYCRLFGNEIVELFVDTFKKAPIAHRQNLCKVRGTWKALFLKSKLFALDNEVRKIDKSWPVFKDGESSSSKSSATKPTTISSPALAPTSAKPAPENVISSKLAAEKVMEQQKNASETKVEQPKKILVTNDPKASEIKNEQKEIPNQLPDIITKEPVEVKEMPKNTVSNFGVKQNENIMRKQIRKHPPAQDPRRHRCLPEKKPRIDESHAFQPTAALGAHAFLAPSLTSMPTVVPFPMPPPPSLSPHGAIPQVLKMEAEDSWRSAAARQPLQPFNQSLSFGPPSFITNETPRFTNASNNRIFVGGRAYEVLYIENEAVIERNGLPHRIHFYGPPRDVLIDGKPLKLAFNEIKTIYIDGVPHTIKFGAPSRELYIGGHPFRGAFGGPPMIANINGRRHEFRLCGSPPEVRIDQDPCYELSRHLYALYGPQNKAQQPKQEEKLEKQDVISLLQKIKKHGILNNKPLTTSKNVSNAAAAATRQPLPPPPQAGSTNIEVVIRQISPPETIKEFQIGVLMVRYSAVIEALHKPRTACPHCGIGFTDIKSEAYQRHIDGHVQDLLRTKELKKSGIRTWNMGIDDWLEYDEMAKVQKPPPSTTIGPDGSPLINGLPASPSDATATTSLNKICIVCHEKFNEYYDDNEDEWKLQEAVVIDNSAIHRSCVEQLESSRNENNENFCNKFK